MTSDCNVEKGIQISPPNDVKGGETTEISEWEELETLSKDELIIELVKERSVRRIMNRSLRWMIDEDYPINGEPSFEESISSFPPKEWGRKIIEYGKRKDGRDFSEERYGLDHDYEEFLESGKKLTEYILERKEQEEREEREYEAFTAAEGCDD